MFNFVILHYKTIDETIRCLECLKKTFNNSDYRSIVVDNHTLTNNELSLIKEYTDDIILLDENLGFAKANNIACKYAKEKYNPDFIAVINNDVFITQKDFINIVKDNFSKYSFDMLGTRIDSPSGESVNPFPIIYGKDKVIKEIKKTKLLIKIYKNPVFYKLLQLCLSIKHFIKKPLVQKNGEKLTISCGLHGCAIIFSKKYLDKYDDVFFYETFLFHEEEFLYLRMKQDNLISVYDPKLYLFHKEESSVKNENKNIRKSKLFREQERLKSLELLKKVM